MVDGRWEVGDSILKMGGGRRSIVEAVLRRRDNAIRKEAPISLLPRTCLRVASPVLRQ